MSQFRRIPSPALRLGVALALALPLSGCDKDDPRPASAPPTSKAPSAPASSAPASPPESHDLLELLPGCEIEHSGTLIDFGSPGLSSHRGFALDPVRDDAISLRDGASFEIVSSRDLVVDLWLEHAIEKPTVALRLRGGAAKRLHVSLDQQRLGVLRLSADETRVLASRSGVPLSPGRHRLALRFLGAPRRTTDALAEIDWVRIGEQDPHLSTYAPPTPEDLVAEIALDRVPRKGISLRAPSTVRCFFSPGRDALLKTSVGLWGSGRGQLEIRVIRDNLPPVGLERRKVFGGEGEGWTPVTSALGAFASGLIGLELRALELSQGGRLVFGDPVLTRAAESASAPTRVRLVVLVVLSFIDRARVPPWGPTGALGTLGSLARSAVVFGRHQASSSVPAAVVASMLTGLSPRAHGLEDGSSRLAPEVTLLSEIVKEASGRTAMFTGVPTSFAAFGFNQGWDTFEMISPVHDLPASQPILRAAEWVEKEIDPEGSTPALVVAYARGAHPPWDVSREDAQRLKPKEYSGLIDPRRGGIILGALRARSGVARRGLRDDDWVRLQELGDASLAKQDQGLGELIATLERKGLSDQTLLVVTGDVGSRAGADLPFNTMGALEEERLLVPLWVKVPKGVLAGREIHEPTMPEDVWVTAVNALGLSGSEPGPGRDLVRLGSGHTPLLERAQLATLPGRYAARLGTRWLRGSLGERPALCALDVDPGCARDVFDQEPVAARALWQAVVDAEQTDRRLAPPAESRRVEPLDLDTANALIVWGDRR